MNGLLDSFGKLFLYDPLVLDPTEESGIYVVCV